MSYHDLPEEEKIRVAAQVDYFIGVIMRRYGMRDEDLPDVVSSLRWLKEHREFMHRVQQGGTLSILALLLSAMGAAIWQGVKTMLGGGR